jgi:hypothetical protein
MHRLGLGVADGLRRRSRDVHCRRRGDRRTGVLRDPNSNARSGHAGSALARTGTPHGFQRFVLETNIPDDDVIPADTALLGGDVWPRPC